MVIDKYLNQIQEIKLKWSKKKKPISQHQYGKLDSILSELMNEWKKGMNQYIKKIIDEIHSILKKGNHPLSSKYKDEDTIYQTIFVYHNGKELYKHFKPIFDKHYKKEAISLMGVMPNIKKLWVKYIKEYEQNKVEVDKVDKNGLYKEYNETFKKAIKKSNAFIVKDLLNFYTFIGKETKNIPEEKYHNDQSLSYEIYDYS